MGCYNPNFIITRKLSSKEFEKKVLECSSAEELEEFNCLKSSGVKFQIAKTKPIVYSYQNRANIKLRDFFKDWKYKFFDLVPIPCGNCIGCRLDYSRTWATRCMLEAEQYQSSYFITLTYDDKHLPIGSLGNATLKPDDFTNFLKRLRIYYKRKFDLDNIRFFGCGEYGDLSFRPHYHFIIFNLPIPDLTPEFRYIDDDGKEIFTRHIHDGIIYYYSDIIHELWGKGNVVIGECTTKSCAYTARYIVKKLKGKSSEAYDILKIIPPFCRMSRKPGLAYQYYLDNKESIYDLDSIVLATDTGAVLVPPPRYFNKIFEIENELRYYEVKELRKEKGNNYLSTLYENTTLHYDDYLEVLEERKELQLHSCKRIL